MLLDACPGFRLRWEEHVAYWNGEPAGVYLDIAEFVHFLIDAFDNDDLATIDVAFILLEKFLVEGDADAKGIATVGIIETLQNAASWKPFGAKAFLPYLRPESRIAWDAIDRLWEGKTSLADVIRAERREGKS